MTDAESVLAALSVLRGMQFVEGGVEAIDAAADLIRSQAAEIKLLRGAVSWRPRAEAPNDGVPRLFFRPANRASAYTEAQIAGYCVDNAGASRRGWREFPDTPYTFWLPIPNLPQPGSASRVEESSES